MVERRRADFLLRLTDSFRQATDEAQILRTALSQLGDHLSASRVALLTRPADATDTVFTPVEQWHAEDATPIDAPVDVSIFGTEGQSLLDGHIVRIDGDAGLSADALRFLAGAGAALAVPWTHNARAEGLLVIHCTRSRRWSDFDVGTAEDVLARTQTWTERERAISREKVLSREVDHRARNLLSVVRAILRLTRAEDAEALRDKVSDRILALARTHSLLARKRWSDVRLGELVVQELEPYGGEANERIDLSGPIVTLHPERAQSVAMVLHELATNAAKHGALSDRGGVLEIGWTVSDEGMILLDWRETFGADAQAVEAAGEGGFGSTLLPLVVEGQLGGKFARELGPDGLSCRIRFRAEHVQQIAEPMLGVARRVG